MRTLLTFIFLAFSILPMVAQGDYIAQSGKINTVISCVAVILIGVVLFLFYLDRRLKVLENEQES